MKKLALIGGIGPESTIEYYRMIIKRFQDQLHTKDYPEILLYSINMTEMLNFVFNQQYDELASYMADKINGLQGTGIDFAALASNTPHIVFDGIVKKVEIPLISIVEVTCKKASSVNVKKVGLFGTKSTMTAGFYKQVANKYEIEVIIPDTKSIEYIHEKYMGELVYNKIVPETKQRLLEIASELKVKYAIEGLILGGTELPLILKQSDCNDIKLFNTTEIHVESIVSKMIEN